LLDKVGWDVWPRCRTKRAALSEGAETAADEVKVFVHLGLGFGADSWRKRYERGLIPGLNEPLPYGYYRAAGNGLLIEYSRDDGAGTVTSLIQRALCHVVGFDIIHAWRNRRGLTTADIVWTHTERENLAALLLFRFLAARRRPRTIAQCVWMFDKWPNFSRIKRSLYAWLLSKADIVTTLSPDNLETARRILPESRTELVMFGIKADSFKTPATPLCHQPARIAALGSDMHRDWKTLLRAFAGLSDFEVRIASHHLSFRSTNGTNNVKIEAAQTKAQVERIYEWADLVVVPLKPNLHGSGLSVILEATILGCPVLATDTGGLRAYFSDDEICYLAAGDAMAMRHAALDLAHDSSRRLGLVRAAQRRIVEAGLTSEMYALRHRELTRDLLGRPYFPK
jgi:glycosyltransferase involved in cell wall biosynthesis